MGPQHQGFSGDCTHAARNRAVLLEVDADGEDAVEEALGHAGVRLLGRAASAGELLSLLEAQRPGAPIVARSRSGSDSGAEAPDGEPERPILTKREEEILGLVASGFTNAQIAGFLWVTQATVKFHLRNIFRKLRVGSRRQAVAVATERDLLRDT